MIIVKKISTKILIIKKKNYLKINNQKIEEEIKNNLINLLILKAIKKIKLKNNKSTELYKDSPIIFPSNKFIKSQFNNISQMVKICPKSNQKRNISHN